MDNCTITYDEFEWFVQENGTSPCIEYGMCERCPYYESEEQNGQCSGEVGE